MCFSGHIRDGEATAGTMARKASGILLTAQVTLGADGQEEWGLPTPTACCPRLWPVQTPQDTTLRDRTQLRPAG